MQRRNPDSMFLSLSHPQGMSGGSPTINDSGVPYKAKFIVVPAMK